MAKTLNVGDEDPPPPRIPATTNATMATGVNGQAEPAGPLAHHMRPVNHGLYMVLLPGHRKEGAFWAVLYLVAVLMIAYQIAALVAVYHTYPIDTETIPIEPLRPADHWPPVRLCDDTGAVYPSNIATCRLLDDGGRCDERWSPSAGGCLTYRNADQREGASSGKLRLELRATTALRLYLDERNGTQDGYAVVFGYTYRCRMHIKYVWRLPPPYGNCALEPAEGDRRRPCQQAVYEPSVVVLPSENKQRVIEFGPTTVEHVQEYPAYPLVKLLTDIGTQIAIWMAFVYLIKLIFIAIQLVVIKSTS